MEVSTKGKATFQPRLQDQNVAPSLEGTVKIDIFSFQGKAPIVWYTDRAPSVNGSRLESSRNVFVLRKGYTNILKR